MLRAYVVLFSFLIKQIKKDYIVLEEKGAVKRIGKTRGARYIKV